MASGRTIRWMERVSSLGLMAGGTMDNMSMIRRKVRESSFGLTVANTMAIGRTESSTAKVCTIQAKVRSKWVSGLRASALTGSIMVQNENTCFVKFFTF